MAPAERFHCESSLIALTAHNRFIDTIPRDTLQLVVRKNLQDLLEESTPLHGFDNDMLIYNIKNQGYVVRFLVQWVKNINIAESLRVCMEALDEDSMPLEPDEEPDPLPDLLEVFHRVIDHFSNMSIYTSDIHDSLVDWYITYLRDNPSDFDNIFMTCRNNDKVGDGSLVRVCANVFVHYGKDLLDPKNHFKLWLRDHIRQSVRGRIPGDVMDPAFNHHCAYHQHGENEICYNQKIQQTFNLPLR